MCVLVRDCKGLCMQNLVSVSKKSEGTCVSSSVGVLVPVSEKRMCV